MQELFSSSSQVLQGLTVQNEKGWLNGEEFYLMDLEVEKKMEEFDLKNREKMAKAVDELSKLVITA